MLREVPPGAEEETEEAVWSRGSKVSVRLDSRAEGPGSFHGVDEQPANILFVRHHKISTFSVKLTISKPGDMEKGNHPVISHEPCIALVPFGWNIAVYTVYYSHACLISPCIKTFISNNDKPKFQDFWHFENYWIYFPFSVVIFHHFHFFINSYLMCKYYSLYFLLRGLFCLFVSPMCIF